jgi:hypothetical protein
MSMSVAAVRTQNDVVAIDVTGTTGENAYLYLFLGPDNGQPCGATIGTWYGEQPMPGRTQDGNRAYLPPGSFSKHFDEMVGRQSGFGPEQGGFLKACAYLLYQSDAASTLPDDVTPRATASAYHISSVVPCPPPVDFTIEETVQLQSVTPEGGTAALRVTFPKSGFVYVSGDDHGDLEDGVFFDGPLEAGTHWIRTTPPDSANAIFKDQKPKTEHFTVRYVTDEQLESPNRTCLKPDDTFVDSYFDYATRSSSIEWTPGRYSCNQVGCPSEMVPGCYAIDMTCYERTLTLKLTRRAWSGTLTETGGGSHCWGIEEDIDFVSLWQLTKGKWYRIAQVEARNGTYSGKLTEGSYIRSKMKMGGTFQASISGGANRGSDYTCGPQLSNLKKLPPA